jgi:acyl-coenzyme A thioesterase PaaI-like protein
VEATFVCQRVLEGYPHVLHGGVICALLDGAMTNCIFATGSAAVTGDLHVRFQQPVSASGSATVRAWIEAASPPLYKLAAQLEQGGEIKATAKARFVEKHAAARLAEGVLRK